MTTPQDAPSESLAAETPPPADQTVADASDLVEPATPEAVRSAEERLLNSIVSDPRASLSPDGTTNGDTLPDESFETPVDELDELPPTVEPIHDGSVPSAPIWDRPADPAADFADDVATPDRGGSSDAVHELELRLADIQVELEAARDEGRQVTSDRDDLVQRLDLAAAEFDRLHQELDEAQRDAAAAHEALRAAQSAQALAQAALSAAQEQAGAARQERDAAVAQAARCEADEARAHSGLEALENTVRQLQAARAAGARRQRVWMTAGAAALALVAVALGYAAGRVTSPARPAARLESPVAVSVVVPGGPIAPVRQPTSTVTRLARPLGPEAPRWPAIRDPRLTVREESGALVILFNEPLFVRGAELTPAARQDLRRLAALLKPYVVAHRIEVEGHTDASPVASTREYASNRELGLSRARAALDLLVKEGGLPATSFSLSSAGDANLLVPGETPDARRRNRTVVIKLHQNQ